MNLLDGVSDQEGNKEALIAEYEAKWKDKPEAEVRRAKAESDLWIKTLERRFDDLKADYLKKDEALQERADIKALTDQIKAMQNQSHSNTQDANDNQPLKFDPKEVESLVDTKLRALKNAEREEVNFNNVKNKLVEKYGNSYQSMLNEQMDTLGLTGEELNVMARTRPTVLIKALGLDSPTQQELFQSPPRSGQRNDNFSPKGQQVRDWNYYQELKKTNPTLYLDRKIAIQMHDDAVALGERFNMPKD